MGPLRGLRVVEMAGLGPGPFAAMMLADMGAEVVRVDRPPSAHDAHGDGAGRRDRVDPRRYVMHRGRRSIAVDLKHPDAAEVLLRMVEQADALIEGFRPGVMERLGLGPEACLARNPRLAYGRMTGWGQHGPLAGAAGHDIDYIALAGALRNFVRPPDRPVAPLNLVGDFGGGGMFLAFGLLCAIHEASRSGCGQVVDAAMVDGTAVLTTMFHGLRAQGLWYDEPGTNWADSGAPYYEVFETADGEYVAVGALERPFYDELVRRVGLDAGELPPRGDETNWPGLKARFEALFRSRTRAEWCDLLEGTDACFAPVLSFAEAPRHPHNVARSTFVEHDGVLQPAPAPRFDRTPAGLSHPPPRPGEHTAAVLADWGFSGDEIARLASSGAVRRVDS
ncbi:MAG TPA: CaiB/BaiF CoA-transferase family protein [Acidimicrobiia bacterium]|nr:CaiB/BaiF CoA-transferase family protein [Acidimicrobiia bacterium]